MVDFVLPVVHFTRGGDQFQVIDVLTNRAIKLVAKNKPGEMTPIALSRFGERFEANVLCKH